jgi:hypothetical protein
MHSVPELRADRRCHLALQVASGCMRLHRVASCSALPTTVCARCPRIGYAGHAAWRTDAGLEAAHMCTTIEQQPCKRVLMPTIGRDGRSCKQRSIPHGPEGPAHAKACTDGRQSANEQRSSAHFAAVRQRSASGVAAARSHGRICPDAGRRKAPRGPEGPVHARAPTACAALA